MHIVISPAKNLKSNFPSESKVQGYSPFLKESRRLVNVLKKNKTNELMQLMSINEKLALLNKLRYKNWNFEHHENNTGPAIYVFNGNVYQGLQAESLSSQNIQYAQKHLSILSGLYGILKPLDGIQPYRLEMGTKLLVGKYQNLYEFWGNKIHRLLQSRMIENGDKVLINLASNEYFKSVLSNKLKCRIISPVFKDLKNGEYKLLSFYFKKARGLMTRFIIENEITDPEQIKTFNTDGYYFNEAMSENDKWVFTRD